MSIPENFPIPAELKDLPHVALNLPDLQNGDRLEVRMTLEMDDGGNVKVISHSAGPAPTQGEPMRHDYLAPGTLGAWQREIGKWADSVFPKRDVWGTISKLVLEEIPEFLRDKGTNPGEYADLVILILDIAYQLNIDVEGALEAKHALNKRRIWARNEMGVYHNVGEHS